MSFIINPYIFAAAGPEEPDDLAGLVRWYKADSYALADGDSVGGAGREWVDQSAFAQDAVQASGGSRPVYKTNIFGSMPAIQFTSAGTQFFTMPSIAIAGNFTIIGIGKVSIPSVLLSDFTSAQIRCAIFQGSANTLSFASGSGGVTSNVLSVAQTSVRQMGWRRNTGGIVSFREQATSRGDFSDTAGDNPFQMDLIGATIVSEFASMHVGEIVVYNQFHSDANVDALYTNYFKPRWGLP